MKLFFVLAVLLSFLGRAFSDETAPAVSTLYSGTVSPVGIWSDANGNIFGCETGFHSVFKITSGGVKTNFAGTHGTAGVASEGVFAVNALFNSPRGVWGDGQFLYITDSANNRIRRVSWTTSLVTTVVGGGTGSILTSGEFLGTSVALSLPNAIAGSSNGKVYFADFGHVYLLTPETGVVGMVSFVAGGGDHIGTFAHGAQVSLKDIQGLAVDPTNNNVLFVADSGNKVVRKMNLATGKSIIFAGKVKKNNFVIPSKPFENGETAYKVTFGNPLSVWVGGDGSVFIADSLYHTISVVRHDKIYLFAGKWSYGSISNTLMTGPANQVQIEASHIFGDSSRGVLYLCDGTRGGIQLINPLTVNVYAPTATPTAPPTKNPTVFPTGQPTSRPTTKPIVHYDSTYTIGVGSSELTDNDKNTICQTILETTVPKPDSCTIIAANFAPIIVDRRRLKQVKPLDGGYNVDVTARLDYDLVNNPTFTVEQLTEAVTAALDQAVQDNSFSDALTTNAATNNAVQLQAATVAEVKTVTFITNYDRPTSQPSGQPSSQPSSQPSNQPTSQPTDKTTSSRTFISKTNFDSIVIDARGMWADSHGNLFVADSRKIYVQSAAGDVSVFAGVPGPLVEHSGDNGPADKASFWDLKGLWGDDEYLYICDYNLIRTVNWATNTITTLAGAGDWAIGETPRDAMTAFMQPQSLWGDGAGKLYIATPNYVLQLDLDTNLVKVLAYSFEHAQVTGADGSDVGFLDLTPTYDAGYISGDAKKNCLYITERRNNKNTNSAIIRKLDLTTKRASIFAGSYNQPSTDQYTDGVAATNIKLHTPAGLWVADDGTVFVADTGTNTISAINPNSGNIYWYAGTWNDGGESGLRAFEDVHNVLKMGGRVKKGKIVPTVLVGNSQLNTLYVADSEHFTVREISPVSAWPTTKPIVHYDSTYTIGVGSSELTDNDKNTICQTILETTVPTPDSCTIIAANFAPIIVNGRRLKQVKPLDGGYNVDVTARLDYGLVNNPTFTVERLTEAVTAALDQAVQDNSFSTALTTNAATNNAVQLQAATVAEVKTVTSSVTNEQSPSAAIPIVSKTKMGSAVTGPNTPFPGGFWADKNGNTFFSDTFKISKQSSTGDVTLFAGSGPGAGGDGGSAIDATIFAPTGFWGDSDNLYFIDQLFPTMKRIRAINFSTNKITLVVGGGQTPADTTPRLATEVTIGFAQSLWGDGRGNIYIANENQVLHFSLDTNLIQQIAYSTDGQLRGEDGSKVPFLSLEAPKALGFQQPSGLGQLAGDATRNCLYITEMVNYESRNSAIIRKFDLTTSTATIFAGQYGQRDTTKYTNGALATSIKFSAPTGLWVADDGTVFMSDPESFTISAINPDSGKVYWFAGTWNNGGQSGIYDYNDFVNVLGMDDLAREGKIVPFQLTGSSAANALYVIDKEHQAVRKITEVLSATGVKPPARRLLALKPPSKFNLRGSGSF
jgi:sugar lactone lactonase YvrE